MAPLTNLHLNIQAEVEELFVTKFREFAAFCAEHWIMTERDMGEMIKLPVCETSYLEGYNDALRQGVATAVDHWLMEIEGFYS